MDTPVARRAWVSLEPCHAVSYFAPQVREHLTASGLKGGWMDIEARTDALAADPWRALGPDQTTRLLALGRTISARLVDVTGFPFPNPIGLPPA